MHKFNGYDIEITRGDSLQFRVSLMGRDLPEGSVGLFTVKTSPRDEHALIEKRVDASGEMLTITLNPKDTDLPPRTYFWDVRVLIPRPEGGFELETPMEYASFIVLDAIGRDFGVKDDPGMDGNVPVLQLLIQQARQAIRELEQLSGPFAPAILSTAQGSAITDSVDGWATSLKTDLPPLSENGEFIPHSSIELSVNGKPFTAALPSGVYAGHFDWVTGELVSTAEPVGVLEMSGFQLMETGTSSTGLKYIRITAFGLNGAIACNRYVRDEETPYADKSFRIRYETIYLYDNDFDLDNPQAALEGLKFMIPLASPVSHLLPGQKVLLKAGENHFSPQAAVTYPVDTKTYIDQKFAALSAAIVGG